ncbi:hypothetical protein [Pseudobacteriovorax antillogorgiicola]|uniref:hypothetical protein n=1 Tax=Pseudobacteriovorax antillogorgiicola TaxID=1513793 RepID=UPI0013566E6F|nr:hypothetical protein [Pseudobacteriovorax antillogorgiicola]
MIHITVAAVFLKLLSDKATTIIGNNIRLVLKWAMISCCLSKSQLQCMATFGCTVAGS